MTGERDEAGRLKDADMPLVIAVWPNNTISIVKMDQGFSAVDLFDQLDQIACPTDATCYLVKPDKDGLCINFDWPYPSADKVSAESTGLRLECHQGKAKRFKWPKTVARDWLRVISAAVRRRDREQNLTTLSVDEIKLLPAAPTETFDVCEVKKMDSFPGVYFSFNSDGTCHYVGEATSVPRRVSKSRPEIGDRRIGIIKCQAHERKLIESYFIGLLDPPGNCQSTSRMSSLHDDLKEAKDGR